MRRTRALAVVLVALAAGFASAITSAQDAIGVERLTGTLAKVKAARAVAIGVRDASVPFSYVGPAGMPIGYSIDLCRAIVDEIQEEIGAGDLALRFVPVSPQNRIARVVEGTVDLECGSTTRNAERQKEVAFSPVFFVSGTKLMVRRGAPFRSYRDFKGRSVAVTEGTTNEAAIAALDARERLGMKIVRFRDHDQSFAALASGKVDAWAGDDALLYAQAAGSPHPREFAILSEYLSYDPYGIMFRKNDPALAAVFTRTFEKLAASRELARIYDQWFLRKLPSGVTLGIRRSPQLESIFEALGQPTE